VPALVTVLTLTVACLCMGCGTAGRERDARDAVARFQSALADRDGTAACAQLSSETSRKLELDEGSENSLLVVMAAIWLGSWFAQSITGVNEYNAERLDHHQLAVSWLDYLGRPDFWQKTLQNWQSEFLAVGSMAILAVYLRQRGSPESKPVGAPHDSTGIEG
jgi:uncharacterized protein DUF6766